MANFAILVKLDSRSNAQELVKKNDQVPRIVPNNMITPNDIHLQEIDSHKESALVEANPNLNMQQEFINRLFNLLVKEELFPLNNISHLFEVHGDLIYLDFQKKLRQMNSPVQNSLESSSNLRCSNFKHRPCLVKIISNRQKLFHPFYKHYKQSYHLYPNMSLSKKSAWASQCIKMPMYSSTSPDSQSKNYHSVNSSLHFSDSYKTPDTTSPHLEISNTLKQKNESNMEHNDVVDFSTQKNGHFSYLKPFPIMTAPEMNSILPSLNLVNFAPFHGDNFMAFQRTPPEIKYTTIFPPSITCESMNDQEIRSQLWQMIKRNFDKCIHNNGIPNVHPFRPSRHTPVNLLRQWLLADSVSSATYSRINQVSSSNELDSLAPYCNQQAGRLSAKPIDKSSPLSMTQFDIEQFARDIAIQISTTDLIQLTNNVRKKGSMNKHFKSSGEVMTPTLWHAELAKSTLTNQRIASKHQVPGNTHGLPPSPLLSESHNLTTTLFSSVPKHDSLVYESTGQVSKTSPFPRFNGQFSWTSNLPSSFPCTRIYSYSEDQVELSLSQSLLASAWCLVDIEHIKDMVYFRDQEVRFLANDAHKLLDLVRLCVKNISRLIPLRQFELALKQFYALYYRGFAPPPIIINYIIFSHSQLRLHESGLILLRREVLRGLRPDPHLTTSLIRIFAGFGDLEAMTILYKMSTFLDTSVVPLICLVDGFSHMGYFDELSPAWNQFWRDHPKEKLNINIYTTIMEACLRADQYSSAFKFELEIVKIRREAILALDVKLQNQLQHTVKHCRIMTFMLRRRWLKCFHQLPVQVSKRLSSWAYKLDNLISTEKLDEILVEEWQHDIRHWLAVEQERLEKWSVSFKHQHSKKSSFSHSLE